MPRVTIHHGLQAFTDVSDWEALASAGVAGQLCPGDFLMRQGVPVDAVFVLLSGCARLVVDSFDGRQVSLAVLGEGHLIGDLEALGVVEVAHAAAMAVEPVTFRKIKAAQFLELVGARPRLGTALAKAIAVRLAAADRRRAASASRDMSRQVAAFLVEMAGPGLVDSHEARVELSQEELAALMSTTRDSTVRALGKLRKFGLVTTKRRAIVLQGPGRLADYALAGEP